MSHVLQFLTDTVCDMEFNPKYPDLLVTSGKEHLQWWKVYPESRKLHPFTIPDYEVSCFAGYQAPARSYLLEILRPDYYSVLLKLTFVLWPFPLYFIP